MKAWERHDARCGRVSMPRQKLDVRSNRTAPAGGSSQRLTHQDPFSLSALSLSASFSCRSFSCRSASRARSSQARAISSNVSRSFALIDFAIRTQSAAYSRYVCDFFMPASSSARQRRKNARKRSRVRSYFINVTTVFGEQIALQATYRRNFGAVACRPPTIIACTSSNAWHWP